MALTTGARLGPYEVLAPIGAGGMGEVYRAKDTRLDRTVAIKVLPAHVSQDPERKARFEREAKAVGSLNHPHICVLHDVGHQDGVDFLVMEYLEGETLGERVAKGPLPIEQVLRYGTEIADALARAHREHIVHRDLKPANVLLTKAGAKLLDFGLAKTGTPLAAAPSNESHSPTATRGLTTEGTLLGTFQYMSPEQLEGKETDHRADIWALGCVLYEMATGRRPFIGKSQASLISAIMTREPQPIAQLQPLSPPSLDRVVKKCLAKDPDDRWDGAHDVADELKWILQANSTIGAAAPRFRQGPGRAAALLVVGALLGTVAWAVLSPIVGRRPPLPRFVPMRLTVNPSEGTAVNRTTTPGVLAVSSDGRYIAYSGTRGPEIRLYLRALGELEARPVIGTDGGANPFFSPDGQWLGFTADGKLKKVRVQGGEPQVICDAPDSRGASWGDDGTILFNPANFVALSRVSADGGAPQGVTKLGPGALSHRWPQLLPGSKTAIFTAMSGLRDEARDIAALTLATGEWKVLVKGASYARYLDGYLLYARGGSILAAPFDLARLTLTGPATTILEDVRMNPRSNGYALFDVSSRGTAVFAPGYLRGVNRSLVWIDRNGHLQPVTAVQRPYLFPKLSPDGRRLAVTIEGASSDDVWLYDLGRDAWNRLTFEGDNRLPIWSPDGTRIAFASSRTGPMNVYWTAADGSGPTQQITFEKNSWASPDAFAPDGEQLVFRAILPQTGLDVWSLNIGSSEAPKPVVATLASEVNAALAPDGRWLAYSSNESGRHEVYVQSYPSGGRKWLVSSGGGIGPRWSHSGKELFYWNVGSLMVASVSTAGEFKAGAPRLLFKAPATTEPGGLYSPYDVTPDGERFIFVVGPESTLPSLVVVPDLLAELHAP